MLPESNACRAEAGETSTLNPSVQQMSLFTGLKGLCASEWTTTLAPSLSHLSVPIYGFPSSSEKKKKKTEKRGEIN